MIATSRYRVVESSLKAGVRSVQANLTPSPLKRGHIWGRYPKIVGDQDILSAARAHYEWASREGRSERFAGGQPANSNRWTILAEEMQREIQSYTSSQQAILFAQSKEFDHRRSLAGRQADVMMMRHCLKYAYPQYAAHIDRFQETEISRKDSLGRINGQLVSDIMFFHVFYILTCLTFDPSITRICEIGGGYGNPARLWLTNPIADVASYTIVDLPESLFFAEVFLRAACPGIEVRYCHQDEDFDNAGPGVCLLVPVHLAHKTSAMSFDIVTNTGSLAEISDEWVAYWTDWLTDQNCSLFYSHNYFAIPVDTLFESRNVMAPLTPAGWHVGQVKMNVPLMLLTSAERNAAELILKRRDGSDPRWIYEVMRLRADEKWTLTDFAYFMFNLPPQGDSDPSVEVAFVRKVLNDLQFRPKELLHVLGRIESEVSAGAVLTLEDATLAADQAAELRELYRANYPQGT